jgi:tetratricopeptide (TPR) repeat protein
VEPNRPQPGSSRDIYDRLLLWASRPVGCLLQVEFVSDLVRRQLMGDLTQTLADREIPFYELVLPRQVDPIIVLEAITAQIDRRSSGVLSITGFDDAFDRHIDLLEAMAVVNYNRDRLVANNLCQIWWMLPSIAKATVRGMPDIYSWFGARLQLRDRSLPNIDVPVPIMGLPLAGSGNVVSNIDDAHQRSEQLLQRFEVAKAAGVATDELLSNFLLPALETLAEVDSQQQLTNLFTRFGDILRTFTLADSLQSLSIAVTMARLYEARGLYEKAEFFYLRALEISEKNLGTDHSLVATTSNKLAGLYARQGLYEKAEFFYLRALAILEKNLEPDHPLVVTTSNNLAELHRLQRLLE